MEIVESELDKSFAVVEAWFKRFSETPVVGELDRGQLRTVFEKMGADFNIEEEIRKKLLAEHYPYSSREPAIRKIWGPNYDGMTKFCGGFTEQKGVIFKETGHQDKTIGLKQFFAGMTALAATTEAEYSLAAFVTQITAQAVNGRLREMGMTAASSRMCIRVPGYNLINFSFPEKPNDPRTGELPFAPVSIPSEFPAKLWEEMKSWRKK